MSGNVKKSPLFSDEMKSLFEQINNKTVTVTDFPKEQEETEKSGNTDTEKETAQDSLPPKDFNRSNNLTAQNSFVVNLENDTPLKKLNRSKNFTAKENDHTNFFTAKENDRQNSFTAKDSLPLKKLNRSKNLTAQDSLVVEINVSDIIFNILEEQKSLKKEQKLDVSEFGILVAMLLNLKNVKDTFSKTKFMDFFNISQPTLLAKFSSLEKKGLFVVEHKNGQQSNKINMEILVDKYGTINANCMIDSININNNTYNQEKVTTPEKIPAGIKYSLNVFFRRLLLIAEYRKEEYSERFVLEIYKHLAQGKTIDEMIETAYSIVTQKKIINNLLAYFLSILGNKDIPSMVTEANKKHCEIFKAELDDDLEKWEDEWNINDLVNHLNSFSSQKIKEKEYSRSKVCEMLRVLRKDRKEKMQFIENCISSVLKKNKVI